MTAKSKTGSVAIGGVGQQNIPIGMDNSLVKFVIWSTVALTSDGVSTTNRMGLGAMDRDGNGRVIMARDQHGITNTSAQRRWLDDACIGCLNTSSDTIDYEASAVASGSWIANNIAIDVITSPSSALILFYQIFYGDDYEEVSLVDINIGASTPTTTLNVGHDLTGLIVICPFTNNASGVSENDAKMCMGFSDGTNQAHITYSSNDATGTSDVWRSSSDSFVLRELSATNGNISGESTVAFQTDGALFTHPNQYGNDTVVICIAFKGPRVKVGNVHTNASAPSDIVDNTVLFTPTSLLTLSIADTEIDPGANTQHGWFIYGSTDGVLNNLTGVFSENDSGSSDTDRFQSDDDCYVRTDLSGNITGRAELKSFDVNQGYTLLQTDATDTVAVCIFTMAIGSKESVGINLKGNFRRNLSGRFQ